MSDPLTADDLLPLVRKLAPEEQVRLARLALREASASRRDRSAYAGTPSMPYEFGADQDPLLREAEGWAFADAMEHAP